MNLRLLRSVCRRARIAALARSAWHRFARLDRDIGQSLSIATYEGSGVVVHPDVVDAGATGWSGYRYWMTFTPYPECDDRWENPSLVVSHDGQYWTIPEGAVNPIVDAPPAPGFNSDPDLLLAGGRLHLFWREAEGKVSGSSPSQLRVQSSLDGLHWSTPCVTWEGPLDAVTSPSVVSTDDGYALFSLDTRSGLDTIQRRRASHPEGPWSPPTDCQTHGFPAHRRKWHLDVISVDGGLLMLLNDRRTPRVWGGRLYLLRSQDAGTTWITLQPSPLLPSVDGWHDYYRSTFAYDGRNRELSIWANRYHRDGRYEGSVAHTTISIVAAELGRKPPSPSVD